MRIIYFNYYFFYLNLDMYTWKTLYNDIKKQVLKIINFIIFSFLFFMIYNS